MASVVVAARLRLAGSLHAPHGVASAAVRDGRPSPGRRIIRRPRPERR
jgi:hypothetical protein